MPETVVLVDDSRDFLDAAHAVLEQGGMHVVGTASTPSEAIGRVGDTQPDVVLIDVHLGSSSGLELAHDLVPEGRTTPVVIMVSTAPAEDVVPLLSGTPAAGFVPKAELSAAAVAAILRDHRHPGGAPGARSRY